MYKPVSEGQIHKYMEPPGRQNGPAGHILQWYVQNSNSVNYIITLLTLSIGITSPKNGLPKIGRFVFQSSKQFLGRRWVKPLVKKCWQCLHRWLFMLCFLIHGIYMYVCRNSCNCRWREFFNQWANLYFIISSMITCSCSSHPKGEGNYLILSSYVLHTRQAHFIIFSANRAVYIIIPYPPLKVITLSKIG
jgi:hypothetical protein